jgi:coenzyme F420-reducing hydrogenase gamma subunit
VTGNVPAMRNSVPVGKLLQRVYVEGSQGNKVVPTDRVPALLKTARPVREFVKVDISVPGCPPPAKTIAGLINDLLEGKKKTDTAPALKFG